MLTAVSDHLLDRLQYSLSSTLPLDLCSHVAKRFDAAYPRSSFIGCGSRSASGSCCTSLEPLSQRHSAVVPCWASVRPNGWRWRSPAPAFISSWHDNTQRLVRSTVNLDVQQLAAAAELLVIQRIFRGLFFKGQIYSP